MDSDHDIDASDEGFGVRASWIEKLEAAVAAGYYRTEVDEDRQEGFPWQNKRCGDCPFWRKGTCYVFYEIRSSRDHTCRYFDPPNHAMAERLIGYAHSNNVENRDQWLCG